MSEEAMACGPVNVLWTGGWDSTFQMLRLLLDQKREVTPVYLVKASRRSLRHELLAMKQIRQRLISLDPGVTMRLAPLQLHMLSDIPAHAGITRAFHTLRKRIYIGEQYEWLARFCAWQRIPDLQLCVHRDDMAHAVLADLVVPSSPGSRHYRMRDELQASPEQQLFGAFTFPVFDFTKQEMADVAEARGWREIMHQTWFCHQPRHGKPCGCCNPCRYTLAEGLGWRIPLHRRWLGIILNRLQRHVSRSTRFG